jgi:Gpi18-like mannosyltransferase
MHPRWDLFVFLLLALTIPLVLVALYPHYAIDDAAITMRYAQNLIRGQGFVYNQGERVLGTTTPIYTLVLSGLGLLFGDFFLPTCILNSLIDVGSLTIVYLLFARRGQTRLGVVASGLIGSYMPLLQMPMWRMETSLYVFFILLTVLAISEGKWHLGAISSGILMLIRPDGAIVAAVFVLCYLLVRGYIPARRVPRLLRGLCVNCGAI